MAQNRQHRPSFERSRRQPAPRQLIVSPAPDLPPDIVADAFDWRAAFPQIFEDGGFDCVVGNPPYIRQEWLAPFKPAFEREFRCYAGTADAYLYFIERGLDVLCPGGRLGFITSGTFSNANLASPFRAWLLTAARFLRSVNFGENQPFADAEMVFPSISILEKNPAVTPDAPTFRAYFMRDAITLLYEGAIYHTTVRGVERRTVFEDAKDRERFILRWVRRSRSTERGCTSFASCVPNPRSPVAAILKEISSAKTMDGHKTQ